MKLKALQVTLSSWVSEVDSYILELDSSSIANREFKSKLGERERERERERESFSWLHSARYQWFNVWLINSLGLFWGNAGNGREGGLEITHPKPKNSYALCGQGRAFTQYIRPALPTDKINLPCIVYRRIETTLIRLCACVIRKW